MDDEYGVMADQIASDMGPVFAITQEEAQMLARFRFPSEGHEVIESAGNALYRSYSSERGATRRARPARCVRGS
jgi:hypothetical protein